MNRDAGHFNLLARVLHWLMAISPENQTRNKLFH